MSSPHQSIDQQVQSVLAGRDPMQLAAMLSPDPNDLPVPLSCSSRTDARAIQERWAQLSHVPDEQKQVLLDEWSASEAERYRRNIESFIGTVKVPVGIVGPLRINGAFANGDHHIPLATTEAALVASYARGVQVTTEAGGCTALLISETVSRSPGFVFENVRDAGLFIHWISGKDDEIRTHAQATTNHGRLITTRVNMEANQVFLNFEFQTADASGQNMVTIATQAICEYILANCPTKPVRAYVEANHSGDKKSSARSFILGRGRKVTAEVVIEPALLKKRLHVTARQMADYTAMSTMGGILSGTIGVQGHYANGLAALYLATGMDIACVAESAVGVTRMEELADGSLHACVTLPNIMVGTIGGGTGLPTQQTCLSIMKMAGADKARALAEVAAGLCLAGELSIIAALASGEFSKAHARLARGKRLKHAGNTAHQKDAANSGDASESHGDSA